MSHTQILFILRIPDKCITTGLNTFYSTTFLWDSLMLRNVPQV